MRGVRGGVFFLGLVAVSSLFVWTASSNSAGAPQNAADTGCTCHSDAANSGVQVTVDGLPEAYAAGASYDVTVALSGGPAAVPVSQNTGGFAMKVSAGNLTAPDGITVTGGRFATHSASTNNQRTWSLEWTAPDVAAGNVNVSVAANSVNGDGTSAGGLDQWNRVTFEIPPEAATSGMGNATSSPSTEPDEGSPGLPAALVGAALVAVVVTLRRRS